jgi:RNA polymerase sigma-70 factor (ECF subfamily)
MKTPFCSSLFSAQAAELGRILLGSAMTRSGPAVGRCSWRMSLVRNIYPIPSSRIRQIPNGSYHAGGPVSFPLAIAPPAILPQIAAGEPRAMEECITRYGSLVWAIARRSISDTSEAEDLVQEVFTEIWKKAASFDPSIASESTFVGMIARRRAIDFLRRIGRRPGFEALDALDSFPQPVSETSSVVCDAEAVRSSLASLPDDTRQLFHLFFDDGFTHPEIAEKTGLPLGTVKTRLRRGLITLREQLQRAVSPRQGGAA